MKINFNSLNLSCSGGNRLIFELSNALVEREHEVTITHAGMPYYHEWFTPIKARIIDCGLGLLSRALNKFALKKINLLDAQRKQLEVHSPRCDINVATYCLTAEPTFKSGKGKPFYLVQHYEPLFFFDNYELKAKAEASYAYPMTKLCVSKWLAEKVDGVNIGNGINLSKFQRHSEIPKIPCSIMFSIRKPSWKHSDLLQAIIPYFKDRECPILSSDEHLSDEQLVRMYNQAEIFVNLSEKEGFGYQPLEAMACGCKVVSTPCSEYLVDMENSCLVPFKPTQEQVIVAIGMLMQGHGFLVENGLKTAQQYDFRKVVDRFEEAIK